MLAYGVVHSLLACALGLDPIVPDEVPEPGDTVAVAQEPIVVEAVAPAWGLTRGGETLRITGGPFDDTVVVTLAGEAAAVLEHGEDFVRVRAPAVSQPGIADLEVSTATGAGALPDAYTYHADGTGRYGAYGVFVWNDYVGGYWSVGASDSASAWLGVTTPSDEPLWMYYAPGMNDCASAETYAPGLVLRVYDAVESVSLTSPVGGAVPLAFDPETGLYAEDGLGADTWHASTPYALGSMAPPGVPSFEHDGVIATPAAFSVTQPAVAGTSLPTVPRAFTVTWDGRAADWVLLTLSVRETGGDWGETVRCVVEDDRSFTVPSDALSRWTSGDYLYITVTRMRRGTGLRSFDHAGSQVYGAYQVSGAAIMQ